MRERLKLVIYGDPRTKKNSSRILVNGNKRFVAPSRAYEVYRGLFIGQVTGRHRLHIEEPVNVKCVYYMATQRRVDLVNLIEATNDLLVEAGVLQDDHSRIVVSHDGSRVALDRKDPRVEIEIEAIKKA